jgi:hypothetical protein
MKKVILIFSAAVMLTLVYSCGPTGDKTDSTKDTTSVEQEPVDSTATCNCEIKAASEPTITVNEAKSWVQQFRGRSPETQTKEIYRISCAAAAALLNRSGSTGIVFQKGVDAAGKHHVLAHADLGEQGLSESDAVYDLGTTGCICMPCCDPQDSTTAIHD